MNTTPHTRTNRCARTRAPRARARTMTAAVLGAVLGAGLSFAPPPPAHAADWVDTLMDWNPYVGSDFMRTSYGYKDIEVEQGGVSATMDTGKVLGETQYGIDLHGGFTPHENFGIETGFFYNFGNEKTVKAGSSFGSVSVAGATVPLVAAEDSKIKMSNWGITLDAMGYYAPLNNNNKNFKLIGTGGVTWTKTSVDGDISFSTPTGPVSLPAQGDASEFGFRVGGGMQFGMTDNTNIRTLIRYQTADFDGVADGAWNYTIGVNYEF